MESHIFGEQAECFSLNKYISLRIPHLFLLLFCVIVDLSTLKADLQIMVDVLGSDPTEVACEAECHKLLATGHVLNYGCPFVCHA